MDLIARDGHVQMLGTEYHPSRPPIPEFRSIGRNRASTFEGFQDGEEKKGAFDPKTIPPAEKGSRGSGSDLPGLSRDPLQH
jgi:hypothetical protein